MLRTESNASRFHSYFGPNLRIASRSAAAAVLLMLCVATGLSARPQASAPLPRPPTATQPSPALPDKFGPSLYKFATKSVQPSYPKSAREARIEGRVVVAITVNRRGVVTSTRGVEGPRELYEAARAAARQWRFEPAVVPSGKRSASKILIFNFRRSD